jgi:hypothetical protein
MEVGAGGSSILVLLSRTATLPKEFSVQLGAAARRNLNPLGGTEWTLDTQQKKYISLLPQRFICNWLPIKIKVKPPLDLNLAVAVRTQKYSGILRLRCKSIV